MFFVNVIRHGTKENFSMILTMPHTPRKHMRNCEENKKRGSRSCRVMYQSHGNLEVETSSNLNLPWGIDEVAVGTGISSEYGREC
jgi:hypothetical protein